MSESIPLRLGARVVFTDRWAGRLSGFEIDEEWEVLNVLVTDGFIRPVTVKLPFDKATWDSERVSFAEATSKQAFAREVPPVAAPARPVTAKTAVSIPGGRLTGALVDSDSRRAEELLLALGGTLHRAPVDQVTFSGKEILVAARADSLARYYRDDAIEQALSDAIARSRAIPADEGREVEVVVRNGAALISGNVRTKQALDTLKNAVSGVPEAADVVMDIVDDLTLESEIAQALLRAGVSRGSEIYPRSALGEVRLFGFAQSAEAAAEAVRAAARVSGLRSVHDRIEVPARAAATA